MKGNKSWARKIKAILDNGFASLVGNLLLIILFIVGAVHLGEVVKLTSEGTLIHDYLDVINKAFENGVAVSVIIVDIVLYLIARIYKRIENTLEEEIKSNADHHAIIWKYSAYKENLDLCTERNEAKKNYFNKDGKKLLCWQYTDFDRLKVPKLDKIILKEYINYAGKKNVDRKKALEHIRKYINGENADECESCKNGNNCTKSTTVFPKGIVTMPELCLFVNEEGADGNLKIIFEDESTHHELPDFIESNAVSIMAAHKTSKSKNKLTMRLKGLDYNEDTNTLIMKTERTNYLHMMLTNRCMDYPIGKGLSVRSLYEYRDYVLPLDKSILGNQVGIEGLIITNDGYTLIEKRNHNYKTTWRNKFAQPISLSMGCKELGITDPGQIIPADPEKAELAIKKMIKTHLEGYGLIMGKDDDYQFSLAENFLGISRDLVEGGKPNMYFYVVVNMNHNELKDHLCMRAETDPSEDNDDDKTAGLVKSDNIAKKLYLYPIKDINANFNYIMKMDMTVAKRVCRHRKYKLANAHTIGEVFKYILWNSEEYLKYISAEAKMMYRETVRETCALFNEDTHKGLYVKECGEAFLGCMAFYRMCRERIEKDYNDDKHKRLYVKRVGK